jgi:hypothetical protein
MNHSMNRNRLGMTNPAAREDDDAAGALAGVAGRPLAHAIALRLLTAKGADAAGLKGYVARTGLADAMVDVLEELTRRVRGMRVEFEDLATTSRAATPTPAGAPVDPVIQQPAPPATAPPAGPRTVNPGW